MTRLSQISHQKLSSHSENVSRDANMEEKEDFSFIYQMHRSVATMGMSYESNMMFVSEILINIVRISRN